MHLNQRYTNWIRISKTAVEKGFNSLHMMGSVLIRLFKAELPIIEKCQITFYTEDKYVEKPGEIFKKCLENNIDVMSWGKDIKWQIQNAERRNLWYVGYVLIHFLYDKVSYFPNETLVIN